MGLHMGGESLQPDVSGGAIGIANALLETHPELGPQRALWFANALISEVAQSLLDGRQIAFVKGIEADATGKVTVLPPEGEIRILEMSFMPNPVFPTGE